MEKNRAYWLVVDYLSKICDRFNVEYIAALNTMPENVRKVYLQMEDLLYTSGYKKEYIKIEYDGVKKPDSTFYYLTVLTNKNQANLNIILPNEQTINDLGKETNKEQKSKGYKIAELNYGHQSNLLATKKEGGVYVYASRDGDDFKIYIEETIQNPDNINKYDVVNTITKTVSEESFKKLFIVEKIKSPIHSA